MRYAKLSLTVAFEDYGSDAYTPLDAVLPVLDEHLQEVVVLDFDEVPMLLMVDYSQKAEQ